ncbi:MAG: tRNA pseudouridine(13) synthase TruD [Candidatus Micrarchaeia archaeon]|jgi:tRNA pseudouridine13 synthase
MQKFDFSPEEFIVEEIAQNGVVLEVGRQFSAGDFEELRTAKSDAATLEQNAGMHRGQWFSWFVLEKREWNTSQALGSIGARMGVSKKRFDCAGNKDRNAVTVQLCSGFAIEPARILGVRVKDVKINGAFLASSKVRLGDLQGNRFTITLNEKNCGKNPDADAIAEKARSSNYMFPNFFGSQRFGSLRSNTAQVGELLLKNDLEGAVMNYLCFVGGEEADSERETGATDARKMLETERDFEKALSYFPKHLKFERELLAHLAKSPRDFAGALRLFPRHVLLLFVHAFQSQLFNEQLDARIAEGVAPQEDIPGKILGYDSELDAEEKSLLDSRGISIGDFKVRSFPEISCKGTVRPLFAKLRDFEVLQKEPAVLRFSLPAGSYATVALEHLLS